MIQTFPENPEELKVMVDDVISKAKDDPEYRPEDEQELLTALTESYTAFYDQVHALPHVKDLPRSLIIGGISIQTPGL